MKISAVSVENFKRIESIKIEPDGDRSLMLIGGKNAQGKSSLMDALTAAFGGKKTLPSDPVRHGAEQAEINVELDDGALSIKREIAPDGSSTIEVRDKFGTVKSPQTMLDKLVGARFLDPLAFLKLPTKEQRAQLMRMIPDAERIAGLDEKRERAFERRTEVGRDLSKAEGELARLPTVEVGTPIHVEDLTAELKRLGERQREFDALRATRDQCERETQQAKSKHAAIKAERERVDVELKRLMARIEQLDKEAADWSNDVATCIEKEGAATKRLDEVDDEIRSLDSARAKVEADLAGASEHNRAIYAAESQAKRRTDVATEVDKLRTESENLTKVIKTIDGRKAEILAAAKLPVPGLGITAEGIALAGVPFAQASAAEQLRVALALAIASSPQLDDIWVRDGALLDDDSLAAIGEQAAAAGKRLWIERVSDRDPGVIVIRDGKVANGASS